MNRTFRHLLVPCVLAVVSTTAACELISSIDRSEIGTGGSGGTSTSAQTTGETASGTGGAATSSGTGGSGGAGGATSSSSGMGGSGGGLTTSSSSSSSSGSSSSTGGMPCTVPTDCPAPAGPCATRLCTAGTCAVGFIAADTPTAMQVPGDCKQVVCDGAGDTITGDDDTDVPTDSEVCTDDSCFGGMPVFTPASKGFDCAAQGPAPKHLCGDPTGAAAGKCVECNATADCGANKTCVANACQ